MLPITVPSGMDFEESAQTTEFRHVAKVITAMSTQDGRIAEELNVWFMTLLMQRAEHRDTQALQAKIDELLQAQSRADSSLTKIDDKEPEDISVYEPRPAQRTSGISGSYRAESRPGDGAARYPRREPQCESGSPKGNPFQKKSPAKPPGQIDVQVLLPRLRGIPSVDVLLGGFVKSTRLVTGLAVVRDGGLISASGTKLTKPVAVLMSANDPNRTKLTRYGGHRLKRP
jgi:hypothetical protein